VPEYTGSVLEFVSLGHISAAASVAATARALARAMAITGRPVRLTHHRMPVHTRQARLVIGLRRQLASFWLVLAVAHCAKSIAPLGVQIVKNILRLVNGDGWPSPRAGGLAISCPVPSCVPIAAAGRYWVSPAVTVIGAGRVPCTPCGSGRLAAARRATAPTAKRTTASKMFGVIWFFMARLLSYQPRSPQRCLASCPIAPALTTL